MIYIDILLSGTGGFDDEFLLSDLGFNLNTVGAADGGT